MNMGFKGGWNRISLVEMLDTKLYPIPKKEKAHKTEPFKEFVYFLD
jgi:hypothetical protein